MSRRQLEQWESAYTADEPAPWDIGRPQPEVEHLAERGLLTGQLLDVGCGTGEHSLLAAASGAEVVGVDISPTAIALARQKAKARGAAVRFEVLDALRLGDLGATFDTAIDSGLFHVMDDEDRAEYVISAASVLRPGATFYLMCFSDLQPGDWGPSRVSQDELRAAFSDGWAIDAIAAATFTVNPYGIDDDTVADTCQAWLATIRRQPV
jgi:SAM-dependent methyltransferase